VTHLLQRLLNWLAPIGYEDERGFHFGVRKLEQLFHKLVSRWHATHPKRWEHLRK